MRGIRQQRLHNRQVNLILHAKRPTAGLLLYIKPSLVHRHSDAALRAGRQQRLHDRQVAHALRERRPVRRVRVGLAPHLPRTGNPSWSV